MGYVLLPYKWGNTTYGDHGGEITWTMDDFAGFEHDASYDPSEFRHALQDAFDLWESVAGIDFVKVEDAADADLMMTTEALTGPTIGLATTFYNPSSDPGLVTNAYVSFDTFEDWAPYDDGSGTSFFGVALHEIGHVLGLDHDDDVNEIMYASLTDLEALGPGDIDGVEFIYGEYDEDLRTEDSRDWIDGEGFADGAPTLSDSGDSGGGLFGGEGGMISIILGLLAALFLSPVAALGAFAMTKDEDDEDLEEDFSEGGVDLAELFPGMEAGWEEGLEVETHHFYGEDVEDHPMGCGCCSCGGDDLLFG